MSETQQPSPKVRDESALYEIRIKGQLDDRWVDRLQGLTFTRNDDGDTLLAGWVADQAALHGLLKTIRDLGTPLLSVVCIEQNDQSPERNRHEHNPMHGGG
jgi:hypothetical protein